MSQQANITVFDGAATPVSHTLLQNGVKSDGTTAWAFWKEANSGLPDEAQIRYTQIAEKLKSGVTKVTGRIEVPVMESISGQNAAGYTAPPKVAYVERLDVVGYYSPRSVETTRRLGEQMLINILNNISTTVTPVTTGPLPELIQKLVQVS
jgi:hypothetical protein